jgi:hypothetical protein
LVGIALNLYVNLDPCVSVDRGTQKKLKNVKTKHWGCNLGRECLPSTHKALDLILITTIKMKKEGRKGRKRKEGRKEERKEGKKKVSLSLFFTNLFPDPDITTWCHIPGLFCAYSSTWYLLSIFITCYIICTLAFSSESASLWIFHNTT